MTSSTPNPMTGDVPPELQLYSLGCLCQQLQALPPQIRAIADAAGVVAHIYVDGVPYFRGDAVQRMLDFCQRVRSEVEGTRAAAPQN